MSLQSLQTLLKLKSVFPLLGQLGVVQTEGGSVQGQNIPLGTERSVDVFKGIPFAAKPGLFEKPKAHPGWDGASLAAKLLVVSSHSLVEIIDIVFISRCPEGH